MVKLQSALEDIWFEVEGIKKESHYIGQKVCYIESSTSVGLEKYLQSCLCFSFLL